MADFTDDDIKAARALCEDLAYKGPGQSTTYRLELNQDAARLLPGLLDAFEQARRDWTNALSGWAAESVKLTADLAATKASLAEAVNLLEQAHDYRDDSKIFAACVAALKAKVRP